MICVTCQKLKNVNAFYKRRKSCKVCCAVKAKAWRAANREKFRELRARSKKTYREKHREEIQEYYRMWYQAHGRTRKIAHAYGTVSTSESPETREQTTTE